jgi:signal transduction histidine kinase
MVEVDEPRLIHALIHLLTNAAQAMDGQPPGTARIRVSVGAERSGMAYVEVEDTGAGIPSPLLERVFEPFFTTRPPSRNPGLGLSFCRDFARGHGGDISVQSELGRGTCFRMRLPLRSSASGNLKGSSSGSAV